MKHLRKAIHHAKKRLHHPEIKGLLILFALTLLLPILILSVAKQTQTKQLAANSCSCVSAGSSNNTYSCSNNAYATSQCQPYEACILDNTGSQICNPATCSCDSASSYHCSFSNGSGGTKSCNSGDVCQTGAIANGYPCTKPNNATGAQCKAQGGTCKQSCLTSEMNQGTSDCGNIACCVPAPTAPPGSTGPQSGCQQTYGSQAYCSSATTGCMNNFQEISGANGAALCGSPLVCCTPPRGVSTCSGYCSSTANSSGTNNYVCQKPSDTRDASGDQDCINNNKGKVCCHAAASGNGNICGCKINTACGLDGQYCIKTPLNPDGSEGVMQCQRGAWNFVYNQPNSNSCNTTNSNGNTLPATWVCIANTCTNTSNGQKDITKCPGGCAKGGQTNKWICVNYSCTNTKTNLIDKTQCGTNGCGQPPPPKTPPADCSCDNRGDGAPKNHFTCKDDPTKSNSCARDAICNGPDHSDPAKMCTSNAQLTTPICTCGHLNAFLTVNGSNDYYCTNDIQLYNDPKKIHTCGIDKNNNSNLACTKETSKYPNSPCQQGGPVAQSTQNLVVVQGAIATAIKPFSFIDVTYHFFKSLPTPATNKVLSAQTISITGRLNYDQASNSYINKNLNINNVPPGNYVIFAKVDGYLATQVKDEAGNAVLTVDPNKEFLTSITTFTPGDITPNPHGDNFIDISDYNTLIGCYGQTPAGNCKLADLNNDGVIDDKDYQLLIGSFGTFGDSYTEPNFTCTADPSCKSGVGTIQLCALKCTKNVDF